jgi:CDP-6-deoxy-D-xylo-4-hexulose-3-dehydrase
MNQKNTEASEAIESSPYVLSSKDSIDGFLSKTYLGPTFLGKKFEPGVDKIYYALAVYGDEEKQAVAKTLDEGWLGLGKYSLEFSQKIADILGKKHGVFVNSGSSGTFKSLKILHLDPDSEVITPACTFATTFSAILNNNLIPVVADSKLGSYNIDLDKLPEMLSNKTKAIILPHTLGNLNDMQRLQEFCKEHNLYFIEDSCDTIGGSFNNQPTGSFSDISVCSFYASHHITAGGGGGMVCLNDDKLFARAQAYRDWGRFGDDIEDIDERFNYHIDGVPYDRKFTYSAIGFNFKPVEMQAAFGLAQLAKLKMFNEIRKRNFHRLRDYLKKYEEYFILPEEHPNADVQWLAFPITLQDNLPFTRLDLLRFLESKEIQTRLLFAGNILRQPAFRTVKHRVVGKLSNADKVMKDTFVIGCHHGLTDEMVDYMCDVFDEFLKKYL